MTTSFLKYENGIIIMQENTMDFRIFMLKNLVLRCHVYSLLLSISNLYTCMNKINIAKY